MHRYTEPDREKIREIQFTKLHTLKEIKAWASSYSPKKWGGSLSFEALVVAAWNFARSMDCQLLSFYHV